MARKKRKTTETTEQTLTTEPVAVAEPPASAPLERPAYIDGPPTDVNGELVRTEEPQKTWGDPYKAIFTSTAKGFEMGENRRFKQRVFKFHERPEQDVIDTLKDHGFTYRPGEKAWTIPASTDTRALSEELAHRFAGETRGHER